VEREEEIEIVSTVRLIKAALGAGQLDAEGLDRVEREIDGLATLIKRLQEEQHGKNA
jgi:hypothetical protein